MKTVIVIRKLRFNALCVGLKRISIGILIGVLMCSCANLPNETFLTTNCLTGIKKVAVVTSISTPEVSYSEKADSISAIFIPLFLIPAFVAAGVEYSIKSGIDQAQAAKVSEKLDKNSIENKMALSFIQTAKNGNCFQILDSVKNYSQDKGQLSKMGYDAVISLFAYEILVRRSQADYMTLTARVRGQLENLKSGNILWDREEIVSSSESHPLDYYKQNGLKELDALLEKAGRNFAYDFLYLK